MDTLDVAVQAVESGLAAQASPSSDGSRPESWATPKASDPQHSGPNMRDSAGNYALPAQVVQWATPIVGDSHLASTPEVAAKRLAEGKVTLSRQTTGKLNPRWVETLMGLPVGWTMPSCACPVTIEPMNCGSSEMELFPPRLNEPSQP
jgi:hypothetical protein